MDDERIRGGADPAQIDGEKIIWGVPRRVWVRALLVGVLVGVLLGVGQLVFDLDIGVFHYVAVGLIIGISVPWIMGHKPGDRR